MERPVEAHQPSLSRPHPERAPSAGARIFIGWIDLDGSLELEPLLHELHRR
jgi:hypothetical protein